MTRRRTPYTYVVYLAHTEQPIGSEKHSVRHYCGAAADLYARCKQHRAGTLAHKGDGARILAAANDRGVRWAIVRVWHAGKYSLYAKERAIKRKRKGTPDKRTRGSSLVRHCPLCNPNIRNRRTRFVEPDYADHYALGAA